MEKVWTRSCGGKLHRQYPKNWITDAAREIHDNRHNSVGRVITIIAKHSPFKLVDVAYMPVPRCETCAHFIPYPGALLVGGTCIGKDLAGETVNIDFGCVQWKEKVG
jgi:hypothetical protein